MRKLSLIFLNLFFCFLTKSADPVFQKVYRLEWDCDTTNTNVTYDIEHSTTLVNYSSTVYAIYDVDKQRWKFVGQPIYPTNAINWTLFATTTNKFYIFVPTQQNEFFRVKSRLL